MRKYITFLLLLVFIVPSVAFASWWNPLSWKVFSFLHKKEPAKVQDLNNGAPLSKDEEIAMLQKKLAELQNDKTTGVSDPGKATEAITDKAALIAEIKSQVTSELKQKAKEEAEANREKTLSEKVGVSRESLASCIKGTDNGALQSKIAQSVESAMKGVPQENRGTPYAIVIGPNGVKTEIRGAYPYEEVKKAIDQVLSGSVTTPYTGEVAVSEAGDHTMGSTNAKVKIIEYSDLECPYCKVFHETMKRAVSEGNGNVAWVYRHWPIHQNSYEKLVAAECVAKLKGNDAFWKYVELIFGMMNQAPTSISDKL